MTHNALLAAVGTPTGTEAVAPPAGGPRPGQPSLRVLVAEDNAVNQKLAVRLLERPGHRTVVVDHGGKAVAILGAGGALRQGRAGRAARGARPGLAEQGEELDRGGPGGGARDAVAALARELARLGAFLRTIDLGD